jgi:hypothetical protein
LASTGDAEIYLSQPGLGVVLGARVLASSATTPPLTPTPEPARNMPDPARSPRQSGNRKTVLARYVHNDRLLDALGCQAFAALRASPGARAYTTSCALGASAITPRYANSATAWPASCRLPQDWYHLPRSRCVGTPSTRSTSRCLITELMGCFRADITERVGQAAETIRRSIPAGKARPRLGGDPPGDPGPGPGRRLPRADIRRIISRPRAVAWRQRFMATYLVSRYSAIPSRPPSRPNPDCLTPPNGAAGLETMP